MPNPSPRLTCLKATDYLAARHGVTVTAEYVRRLNLTHETRPCGSLSASS